MNVCIYVCMYACVTWLYKYVFSYTLRACVFVVYGAYGIYLCMLCVCEFVYVCYFFTHFVVGNYVVNLVCKGAKN